MVPIIIDKLVGVGRSPLAFPLCVYTLVFLSIQILEVPFVRLFEQAIRNRYYRAVSDNAGHSRDIGEGRYKNLTVQDRLTTVASWKFFFDAVPGTMKLRIRKLVSLLKLPEGVLTAVLYGTLADRYSPQFVISLSIIALALASLWNMGICSSYHGPTKPSG